MKLLRLIQAHHIASVLTALAAPFIMNFCLNQVDEMRIIPVVCVGIFQAGMAVIIAWRSTQDNGRRDVSLPDELTIQGLFWTCGIIPLVWTSCWVLYTLTILVPPR